MPQEENYERFIEKLKRKDQDAWEEAYELYYPKTEAFLRSIKYPSATLKEDAKDIWQETVIVLFINLAKGKVMEDLGGYIYGIIKRKGFKKLNEKMKKTEIKDNNLVPEENEYERLNTFNEIVQDVFKDMAKQKGLKHCIDIIRMFFLERKRDREIAEKTQLSEAYIRVRRSKVCLPYFRKAFAKHYKFPDLQN
ncbi:RNA polymerase sigma factor [Microscilla marina]|uniref:Sigma-70 family RNA polymerase sigma factor n=1 Tax=Microscilla marina ATCC 23134 TaxID=313606 RepID=A1ZHP6_MICM2|nr:sigma-70 family RNA polymerase sigma factor [Microscilla marina]EAY30053.1 hypothetical protein M23134_05386 [Microscilla marina ATCC 23134]